MSVRGRLTESGVDNERRRCPGPTTTVAWEPERRAFVVRHGELHVVLFPDATIDVGDCYSIGVANLAADEMPTLVMGRWSDGRWRLDAPNQPWFGLEFDAPFIQRVPPQVFSLAVPDVCDSVAVFASTSVEWEGTTGHVGVASCDGKLQLALATRWPGGGDRFMLCIVEPTVHWCLVRLAQ
jgi:hypothetical protein